MLTDIPNDKLYEMRLVAGVYTGMLTSRECWFFYLHGIRRFHNLRNFYLSGRTLSCIMYAPDRIDIVGKHCITEWEGLFNNRGIHVLVQEPWCDESLRDVYGSTVRLERAVGLLSKVL